ncbi:DUF1259 domain-containing protein [Danxiaibacter flavus]|uniref:DUF1259 domain-containing protein n=1 Tax=Danxiaibacter flavus TaxID=3049108 RepID=A0ABV3ZKA8_9BACT|nr:DUF1259 domain-containing protein [Chitinophagaceae bacterium DXS]
MKRIVFSLVCLCCIGTIQAQVDSAGIEKVFGKKGAVQGGVYKVTFTRSDLKVQINDFSVAPGLAFTSWIAFMKMGNETMMMGDLVMQDAEVAKVVSKLVSLKLEITAIHNHLVNERPAIKYLHFSGHGDAVDLAQKIKSVLGVTATPLSSPPPPPQVNVDWSGVESVLGNKGKHVGNLLQYSFVRNEQLTEGGMQMPPAIGMATAINFQMDGNKAGITGDFVLLADEVNAVIKALTENGIAVTAVHNHMLYDNPRLFMLHFWAVDDPAKLAAGLKAALDKTNSKK